MNTAQAAVTAPRTAAGIIRDVFVTRTRTFLGEIARLNKKASRIGVAPILVEDLGRVQKLRTDVTKFEGKEEVREFEIDVQHYRLTLPEPANCPWETVAKITPIDGGAFVEPTPHGGAEFDLEPWKKSDPQNCDHCHTRRQRLISYVVRNKTDGRIMQLGRNCFEDYVGKDTLAALEFQSVIVTSLDCDEEGYWGGGGIGRILTVALRDCVAYAEMLFRTEGWRNNIKDKISGDLIQEGTHRIAGRMVRDPGSAPFRAEVASLTRQLAEARHGLKEQAVWEAAGNVIADSVSQRIVDDWKSAVQAMPAQIEAIAAQIVKLEPTEADYVSADAAIERIRDLEPADEFGATLKNVCEHNWIPEGKASLAAYSAQFLRQIDRKAQEAALNAKRIYRGVVGQREVFPNLVCVRSTAIDSDFGAYNINVFHDADNNVLVWKTGIAFAIGEKVNLNGTVKAHGLYRDTKQTVLSRCKVLDSIALDKIRLKQSKLNLKNA